MNIGKGEGALTVREAADFARVSFPTMLTWVKREDFPAFRSGRRWIIPREAFVTWLAEQARQRVQI